MTPDQSIDRVLQALRDAAPPAGMERRILNTLEAETQRTTLRQSQRSYASPLRRLFAPRQSFGSVIPSGAKRSRGIPVFRDARATKLLRWTPIAALAALTVAALLTLTPRRHTPATPANSTHQTFPQAPAPQPPTTVNTTATSHHTIAPPRPTQPHYIEISQPEETAPLSHPAPPIPLTAQERLLLRYARHGRTDDLAQISNERKAAREEQEAAEFQAFFEPPIKIGESE